MTDPAPGPANIIGIPDGPMLQDLMGQITGNPGPRVVPGHTLPVPTSVSAELQSDRDALPQQRVAVPGISDQGDERARLVEHRP